MSRDEKLLTSVRRWAILIFILTVTASYLNLSVYQKWTSLIEARRLISQWIVYDSIMNQLISFENDEGEDVQFSMVPNGSFRYYQGLGQTFVTANDKGFLVSLENPREEDIDPQIPDLQPWTFNISKNYITDSIFAPVDKKTTLTPEAQKESTKFNKEIAKWREELAKSKDEEARKTLESLDYLSMSPRQLTLRREINFLTQRIETILSNGGIELQKDENPILPYKKFEQKIYSARVKIPVIDLETSSVIAFWIITLMTTSISFLIMNELASINSNAVLEEPWFILDAKTLPAIVLSKLWLVAFAFSPIVAATTYLFTLSKGKALGDPIAMGFKIHVSAVLVLGVLASINTTQAAYRLLSLRSARRMQLNDKMPDVSTSKSTEGGES